MTTKNSFYAFAALAALTLAGCNNDEDFASGNYPEDNVVRVTAGVDNLISRAAYTTDNLTEFGFCIHSDDWNYSYNNYKVTKSDDGTWTSAQQMLWQNATQPVTIVAYAPYNGTDYGRDTWNNPAFGVTIGTNQSLDTDHSDFLFYKKTNFVPENDLNAQGAVNIIFKHMLSQVNLTVTLGTEFNKPTTLTTNPIQNLTIGGTIPSGTCDFGVEEPSVAVHELVKTVEVTPTNGDFKAPADETKNGVASYSAILIPQTVEAGKFTVSFAIGEKTYKWVATEAVTLESGKSHKLELTVGKDVVLTGTITATAWENEDESTYLETE